MSTKTKIAPEATEVIPLNDDGDGPITMAKPAKPKRQRPSRAKPKADPAPVEVKEPAP